jgi:tetratricopeptide (TPR) repeat protein
MLQELGRLDEAEASYKKAIDLKPDYAEAWNNIFFSLQAIKLQSSSLEDRIPLFDEQTNSKYVQILKSILNYRLNLGNPSTDKSFKDVLNILSSTDNTFIKNPEVSSNELIKPTLPEKITALVHFGRSGTGLMHSLIDGHPKISTLPCIYFSEFFDHFTWEKIIADGWEEMADRFATIYDVLFDGSSNIKIPSKGNQYISNIGQKEGMTNVGTKRDEVLSVNKNIFIKELKQLMTSYDQLDQFTFFKLVHSAYEITLKNPKEKNHIFYHIHNPDYYAQLNFLRLAPNTNWLVMVREPLQSCESWVREAFPYRYINISNRIFQMLFEVDHVIYQNQNSIGVRLEDLKENPKKTIKALCNWLDIKENDSLYEMTAQGKKWWGDGTSPEFAKDETEPFGKSSINHKVGLIFSENDQFILRTLFYPFSVRFGYAEENLEKFKKDLLAIRPMLDQMFDFEKKITQDTKVSTEKFMKSGPYLYLRSGMIERWNTLNKFHTYPNMLSPLKIN